MAKKTKKRVSDKVLIVMPYYPKGAQGRELEFAIAGWRKHFKEDFLLAIVGEGLPTIEGKDVVCIESERVGLPQKPNLYRPHLDYVKCFRKVHKLYPEYKGFVFTADDNYLVNDCTLADIQTLKINQPEFDGNKDSFNLWEVDMWKTRKLLDREGYPHRNFTTHVPQYYEWDKLIALYDKYDMDNESYVFENLYFNIYNYGDEAILLNNETDNIRFGAWHNDFRHEDLCKAFKTKQWIVNSPSGYTYDLANQLAKHYGL